MGADNEDENFKGNFMFVGNSANDCKKGTKIRSHLMREYYRKERWKKCITHHQRQYACASAPMKETPLAQSSPWKEGPKSASPSKIRKNAKLELSKSGPGSRTVSTSSTLAVPGRLGSVPQPDSPALQIPYETNALPHRSPIIVPCIPRPKPSLLPPEEMPEPLFCPPLPNISADLSSATETAFSQYLPSANEVHNYTGEYDQHAAAKSKERRSMRALVEHLCLKRPSLCGNPGSEIFIGPFGYLPIKLNEVDYTVLQYYTRVPEIVYNISPNNRFAVHNSIFLPNAFIYPESLYMCLASANLYMAQRYSVTDKALTNFYKQKAYQRVQQTMSKNESRYSDEVVAGLLGPPVLALGASPDEADLVQFMQNYMALTQVIRMRGGHESLRNNVRLDMGYSAIVLIIGKTWSDCLGRVVPPGFEEHARADIYEFISITKDIGDWLRDTSNWAQSLVQSESVQFATTPQQVEMFRKDSALYRVLDYPEAMNEVSYKQVMFERSHHTFAVIFLAIAMYRFRDQPSEAKDAFLDRLKEGLRDNDISKAYTSIPLAWMLMQLYTYEPDRSWLALSYSKVVWRFSLANFNILKQFLLWLICPDETRQPVMTEAMIQRLERDVLNDFQDSIIPLASAEGLYT